MKKTILSVITAVSLLAATGTVFAAKPADNKAGAQKYAWHLSGDVMPVPPYGLSDISGSDTASKMIVNQPNGKVQAMVTGDMNGLNPNTAYTVYLSNPYSPYVATDWNITGAWDANFVATSGATGTYPHHMALTQTGGALAGNGFFIPAPEYTWVVDSGSVTGNHVTFHLHYTGGHPEEWTTNVDATIQSDGSLQGTWSDNQGNSGTVTSYTGAAVKTHTGGTGWSGQLDGTTPFTFVTDSNGSGSWDYNFKNAANPFSVWINGAGGTILVSDNVTL